MSADAILGKIFLTGETWDWAVERSLTYSFDYWLVLLSCLVAIFASYTAFHLVTRVIAASNRRAKAAWLVGGAVSMGAGIWSMHFIGMLAVMLPATMRYDITLTGLSVVFATIASGFAFYIVTKGGRTLARLVVGGVLMGSGIGAMHYTGMAAMRMDATIRYDPILFAVSVLVAVSLSCVALRLLYQAVESSRIPRRLLKMVSGCVMGLSIAAMHYTAMAATYFLPTGIEPTTGLELDASFMAATIAITAFAIIGLALIASIVDHGMEIKNNKARERESFLATVVDNTADGIIAIDRNGTVLVYNSAAERMFGYDESEVVGNNISMVLPLGERAAHDGYVRNSELYEARILGARRPLSARRKDGSAIELEISVSSMWSDQGRTFIGVCHDITERKRAEEALRAAKEQAEIANRAKSQFLANMSHELRTPLNAIIGFSEMIRDETFGPVGSPKYVEYVKDINESGKHLLAIISDILDLSKIEEGKVDLHEEAVEPSGVIESCLLLVKERAETAGVVLESDVANGLAPLYADERLLKQILINLLSNAIKFTSPGGRVEIKAWSRPDSGYVFQVADTGIGIALDDIPKALAPFKQIDSELNRKYAGTGLGLPLTKSLAELHGGSLDLQSEVGVGTTVTVRFPAERIVSQAATGT